MDADISFVKLVQDHVWDPHRRILVVTRWLETCVYGISHDWDLKACHAACVHLTHTQMQPYKRLVVRCLSGSTGSTVKAAMAFCELCAEAPLLFQLGATEPLKIQMLVLDSEHVVPNP